MSVGYDENSLINDSLYGWPSPQRPPWRQEKVAAEESFKQESMYGLSAKKVAVADR